MTQFHSEKTLAQLVWELNDETICIEMHDGVSPIRKCSYLDKYSGRYIELPEDDVWKQHNPTLLNAKINLPTFQGIILYGYVQDQFVAYLYQAVNIQHSRQTAYSIDQLIAYRTGQNIH